jgi:hypothetical protein
MKTIVNVTAQAFDAKTGKAIAQPRTEEINLLTNSLFNTCNSLLDVKEAYENFWNRLSPNQTKEIIFVQQLVWVK